MARASFLSRRNFLSGGSALAARQLYGQQEPQLYGISAVLDGSGLVRIPAGEFQMGSEHGNPDETPVHRVRISRPFEMSKYEVTQAQWETVMADAHPRPDVKLTNAQGAVVSRTPSHFKGRSLPVESVSWDDIELFFSRLNRRDSTHLYRLPTEAEWEYARQAGKASAPASDLGKRSWYKANSEEQPQPVGGKEPNAWGLFDMDGNVSEWVADWYGPGYYEASPAVDPTGPKAGSYRVYRGGSWLDDAKYCRPTLRRFEFPVSRLYNVGFRVVRVG